MRRRFLRTKLSRSLSVDDVLIKCQQHARYVSEVGDAFACSELAGSGVQPDYMIDCWQSRLIAIRRCTVALAASCTVLRLIFLDSHFFALRYAVVSQCHEFNSQTAMRNRINYSCCLSVCLSVLFSPVCVFLDGFSYKCFGPQKVKTTLRVNFQDLVFPLWFR